MQLTSVEICAGGGGQALGLEQAGFEHLALVEIEPEACNTLRLNRPNWNVIEGNVRGFSAKQFQGVDLLAGGVPCPPFSIAGKQLGSADERDLFPEAIRLVKECNPKAILLENVRGLLSSKFSAYRQEIISELHALGYKCDWKLVNASEYGLPQSRARAILIALKPKYYKAFHWPMLQEYPPTVGDVLYQEMKSNGWEGAEDWKLKANGIGPTIVGGSKKHGGADLGPTRARQLWSQLNVDGSGVANLPPSKDFIGVPKLTLKMVSILQGFPNDWVFVGKKTNAYRQIGNAFPPIVAKALGESLANALKTVDEIPFETTGRESQIA